MELGATGGGGTLAYFGAYLERLEETLAILSDPATMQCLAESDAEIARG